MNGMCARGCWPRLATLVVALFVWLPGYALGLGDVVIESRLGESLEARIPVIGADAEQLDGLRVRFADAEQRTRWGLPPGSTDSDSLRIELVKTGSKAPYVRLSSTRMLREPVVRLLVEAAWAHGRLLREYSLALDR